LPCTVKKSVSLSTRPSQLSQGNELSDASRYSVQLYAITVKYRAALVGAIYLKTLRLASHASRPLGTGVGSNYM
jgi:hypothetical protein